MLTTQGLLIPATTCRSVMRTFGGHAVATASAKVRKLGSQSLGRDANGISDTSPTVFWPPGFSPAGRVISAALLNRPTGVALAIVIRRRLIASIVRTMACGEPRYLPFFVRQSWKTLGCSHCASRHPLPAAT
jgi:hypothetical protein